MSDWHDNCIHGEALGTCKWNCIREGLVVFSDRPKSCRHPKAKQEQVVVVGFIAGRWCTACGAIKDTEARSWRRPTGVK